MNERGVACACVVVCGEMCTFIIQKIKNAMKNTLLLVVSKRADVVCCEDERNNDSTTVLL
jgi:hypothetical protein